MTCVLMIYPCVSVPNVPICVLNNGTFFEIKEKAMHFYHGFEGEFL